MERSHEWELVPVGSMEAVHELGRKLNRLPEALARALVVRGVETYEDARLFFRASLESLHDPRSMADMDAAVSRVIRAIEARERVVVYGDYDVDGTTATALMTHFLRGRGVPAAYFIPDRFKHGYGLCNSGIDAAREMGATLLIALDCGITARQEAAYAATLGIDLVICDHHTVPEVLPEATAVLDPKRPDCAYPFRELCGCGVAFKLVQAVTLALGGRAEDVLPYLDLVALATAADVVPLTGENRILLREGMKILKSGPRVGIRALAQAALVDLSECDTRAIQFGLAPRINAAGRLGDAKRAVKLLLCEDGVEAARRAEELERINQERRALDQQLLESAATRAEVLLSQSERRSIVLFDPTWHLGVIGIVAARLADRFHLPTILLGQTAGVAKGSARSVAGVNIYDAITQCSDILLAFGGHDYAAGLSLNPEKLETFSARIDVAVQNATTASSFVRRLQVDAEVYLPDIDSRFWAVLEQFGPFGEENAPPLFVSRGVQPAGSPSRVGKTGDHLKFRVKAPGSGHMDAIAFGLGERIDVVHQALDGHSGIDLAFSVSENNWKGQRSLQLVVRDMKPQSES